MSLNMYNKIIDVATENNVNLNLMQIGDINNSINKLIERGIAKDWIINNLELIVMEVAA